MQIMVLKRKKKNIRFDAYTLLLFVLIFFFWEEKKIPPWTGGKMNPSIYYKYIFKYYNIYKIK